MAIQETKEERLSPFVTLVTKTVQSASGSGQFHSFRQADYVTVVAIDSAGRLPLVRQYRSCVDAETLEFPGGLREASEAPAECAVRELYEECGVRPVAPIISLPPLSPDPGRLENTLWPFFMQVGAPDPGWTPEPGVACTWMSRDNVFAAVRDGRFAHAGNLGILAQVMIAGHWQP